MYLLFVSAFLLKFKFSKKATQIWSYLSLRFRFSKLSLFTNLIFKITFSDFLNSSYPTRQCVPKIAISYSMTHVKTRNFRNLDFLEKGN